MDTDQLQERVLHVRDSFSVGGKSLTSIIHEFSEYRITSLRPTQFSIVTVGFKQLPVVVVFLSFLAHLVQSCDLILSALLCCCSPPVFQATATAV